MSDTPKVKPESEMDAETFLKHINARHVPLGRLRKVGKSNVPGDGNEDLLRTYHRRIHESEYDQYPQRPVNHTHRTTTQGEEDE